MLIRQEALIPFPVKAGKLSAVPQAAWGRLWAHSAGQCLLAPPQSCRRLPQGLRFSSRREGEDGEGSHSSTPADALPPGEPVTTAAGWGPSSTEEFVQKVAKRPEGGTEQVPKFQQPLGLVPSLHSTGFYRNQEQILFPEGTPSR